MPSRVAKFELLSSTRAALHSILPPYNQRSVELNFLQKIASEYDQEMPQSQSADKSVATFYMLKIQVVNRL